MVTHEIQSRITGSTPLVLVLDDDLLHGALVSMVLTRAGFIVRHAQTLEDAIVCVVQNAPDLILANWDIDGIDGRAAVLALRRKVFDLRTTPALLLSDRSISEKLRMQLSRENFCWILEKPIVATSLPKLASCTIAGARGLAVRAQWRAAQLVASGDTASVLIDAVR